MTTENQVRFVTNLLERRVKSLGASDLTSLVTDVLSKLDQMDTRAASVFIDRLKDVPEDPDPLMPTLVVNSPRKGVNSRTQACVSCRRAVPAGEGYYYKDGQDHWQVIHKVGQCTDEGPSADRAPVTPGFYKVGDKIIMVYETRNHRLAGKLLVGESYQYTPGAVFECALGERLSAADAAAWGKLHKKCIVCRHSLEDDTDGKSLDRGYGPVCAKKNGWPWG